MLYAILHSLSINLHMSIRVRKFREADAAKVSNIIKKGFRSIISDDYSKKSVEWQIKENSPKKLTEKAKNVKYYVAVDGDKVLGFGGYNAEKVHTFFVDPGIHGKGIGSKIMERVLSDAKKDGVKAVKCWATFNSVQFYSKFGFKKLKKIKLRSGKNSITFMEMKKKL